MHVNYPSSSFLRPDIKRDSDRALVEACDGGQVEIQTTEVRPIRLFSQHLTHCSEITQHEQIVGTFVEIIGHVVDESNIKLLKSLNLDSDKELGKLYHPRVLRVFNQIPDMKLVNDVVELTFDPRFTKMFPS